jgi:hypothetical protein
MAGIVLILQESRLALMVAGVSGEPGRRGRKRPVSGIGIGPPPV